MHLCALGEQQGVTVLASPSRGSWWMDGLREIAPLLGLGIQFAVLVLVGVGGGWWVDRHYHVSPWGILIGGIIGIAVGFYHFIRTVLTYTNNRKDRRKDAS